MERRSFLIGASSVPAAGAVSFAGVASAAESEISPFVHRFRSLGYERAVVINPVSEYYAEFEYLMADGSFTRASKLGTFRINIPDGEHQYDLAGWHDADLDEFNANVRGYVIARFVEEDGHWTRCL